MTFLLIPWEAWTAVILPSFTFCLIHPCPTQHGKLQREEKQRKISFKGNHAATRLWLFSELWQTEYLLSLDPVTKNKLIYYFTFVRHYISTKNCPNQIYYQSINNISYLFFLLLISTKCQYCLRRKNVLMWCASSLKPLVDFVWGFYSIMMPVAHKK